MSPEVFGLLVASVLGSGGLVAVVTAWTSRREVTANAMQTWSTVWNENLATMRVEIDVLRGRVALLEDALEREQAYSMRLVQALHEHDIDIPPEAAG